MKKKGISLILLVITIIIIIILAGSVILSLVQNSPIENANEAKFKNDVDIFKSELLAYLSEKLLDSNGTFESKLFNSNTETNPIITDVIKSMYGKKNGDTLYTDIFEIKKGELVLKGTVDDEKTIEWAQEIDIGTKEEIIERVESTSELWQFDPETRIISGYLGSDLATLTTITIPNYIDGIPVDVIIGNVEEYSSVLGNLYEIELLKEVIISEGITTIGDNSFYNGSSLLNITIPDSVTNIQYQAFAYSGITNITLGNNITNIGGYAFEFCPNLTNVTVENGTIGEGAFEFCDVLTSVMLGTGVTSIGDYAFEFCPSLTNITVENATIGEGAFEFCDGLTSVTIGTGVTSIGNFAFEFCPNLTNVTVENGTIGEGAFQFCDVLATVTLGNGITSIGDYAFDSSPSLETITLPASVTTLGQGVFNNCGLISIEVDSNNTAYSSLNGILTNKAETIIIQYPIAKIASTYVIPLSITNIEVGAFAGCKNLTSIVIPDSITSIGDSLFDDCSNLTSVTIGSGIASITNNMFNNCSSLNNIIIPNNITSIGEYAFYSCDVLTSVTIGNSVTNIGKQAFSYCNSLTNITIPNSVVTIHDFAFSGCNNLASITINKPLNSIINYPWGATNAILNWTM